MSLQWICVACEMQPEVASECGVHFLLSKKLMSDEVSSPFEVVLCDFLFATGSIRTVERRIKLEFLRLYIGKIRTSMN